MEYTYFNNFNAFGNDLNKFYFKKVLKHNVSLR